MSSEKLALRAQRVMSTVQQMLRDRGYLIDDEDYDMDEERFMEKYGPVETFKYVACVSAFVLPRLTLTLCQLDQDAVYCDKVGERR